MECSTEHEACANVICAFPACGIPECSRTHHMHAELFHACASPQPYRIQHLDSRHTAGAYAFFVLAAETRRQDASQQHQTAFGIQQPLAVLAGAG